MDALTLIMLILAAYRLARIVSRDTISEQTRAAIGGWAAGPAHSWRWYVAELVNCPLCIGVWISAALAISVGGSVYEIFIRTFAIAGGQTLLALYFDGGDDYGDS